MTGVRRLLLVALIVSACESERTLDTSQDSPAFSQGVHYFESVRGLLKARPVRPSGRIGREAAEQLNVHFIGTYDADGRLIRFAKIRRGEEDWLMEYTYWPSGTLRELRTISGQVLRYDPDGKPLPP